MRNVAARLKVWWDGSSPTTETANLVDASGSMRLSPPGEAILSGRGQVDEMRVVLRNPAGRYSPLLSTGALYASIADGGYYQRKVTFEVSIDGGSNYTAVFTGVVKSLRETGASSRNAPEVELVCRSMDDRLLQKKLTTTSSGMATRYDQGWTEAQIMDAFLAAAGLTNGVDYVLDPGLFVIPWSWLDDEPVLEDIWQLAAACGGRAFCDRNGILVYENALHWLNSPHNTSQETLDTGDFQTLRVRYDDGNLFNSVTVEVAPRQAVSSDVLWEPDEDIVVPAGASKTVVARLRTPVYRVDAVNWHATTTGGADITASVSLSRTDYAQRLSLAFANAHATHAAYIRGLQVVGAGVVGAPSAEETRTSTDSFWTGRTGRNRSLRGNPYIQSRAQAGMLASMLCDWLDTPRVLFSATGCPGDPLRSLGRRVTISDANSLSSNRDAYITGISWRYDRNGFKQDLEMVDAAGYYPYADTGGYFIVGTSVLGATTEPVFY